MHYAIQCLAVGYASRRRGKVRNMSYLVMFVCHRKWYICLAVQQTILFFFSVLEITADKSLLSNMSEGSPWEMSTAWWMSWSVYLELPRLLLLLLLLLPRSPPPEGGVVATFSGGGGGAGGGGGGGGGVNSLLDGWVNLVEQRWQEEGAELHIFMYVCAVQVKKVYCA